MHHLRKIKGWITTQTIERDVTVSVAAVSVMVVMILGLINYHSLIRVAENELQQRVERTNVMIARRVGRVMSEEKFGEAIRFLDDFKHHSPIAGIRLIDNNDQIVYNYFSPMADTDELMRTIEAPVMFNNRQHGVVHLTFSAKNIQDLRTNMLSLTVSIIIALSITLIVTVRTIVKKVLTISVRKIQTGVRTFARGDYDYRIDPGHYMDLQPTIQEINSMAIQISERTAELQKEVAERERAQKALKKLNEELEQRVESRTADLELSNRALTESLNLIRQTQLQLIESEKLASLGSMVAGVAHEINNPLGIRVTAASHLENKLKDFIEGIKSNSQTDIESQLSVLQESTQIIRSNLKRASELISGFKKVAVDQTGEEKRIFNFYDYLQEIMLSLRPELKKAIVEVNIECPENLKIESYPGAISQVLTNLVLNTMRHGFKERQKGRIDIHVKTETDEMIITYHDDGMGISEHHRSKIFDPFFTTERGSGGSGLGLHIVFSIVTNTLKGTVSCESTPNEGCRFILRIPASQLGTCYKDALSEP